MNAKIIIIGDEILLGRVVDTNSGFIARQLDPLGIYVSSIHTVGDNAAAISDAIELAMGSADIVITTGGLGPTKDDITKKVLTEIFGGEMVRNDEVTENIKAIFAGRNLKLNRLTLDQALVPSSARIIQNRLGTAPIMVFHKGAHTLVAMPGVPSETEGMFGEVTDYLARHYKLEGQIFHSTRVVTGMSESALAESLASFEDSLPYTAKLAYLPDSPLIKLRLDWKGSETDKEAKAAELDDILAGLTGLSVLANEDISLPALVLARLRKSGLTLSTAESCTGGNIAHLITEVPGSSDVFNGGVVSYANSVKEDVLGVPSELLERHGAVSREVVTAMAEGACRELATDCAVATSGIAGPSGGTADKPVGTVWMAVRTPKGTFPFLHHFRGDRKAVINRASATVLIHLLECL